MLLTPKQKEIVGKKIGTTIPNVCPICKSSPIIINDRIFELREFERGDIVFGKGTPILPVIVLNCSNCGHTYFLNAVILGLIASDEGFKDSEDNGKENDNEFK